MLISFPRAIFGPLFGFSLLASAATADTVLVERCTLHRDAGAPFVLILTRGEEQETVTLGRNGVGRRAMVDRRAAMAFLRSRMGPRAKDVIYSDCLAETALDRLIDPRKGIFR